MNTLQIMIIIIPKYALSKADHDWLWLNYESESHSVVSDSLPLHGLYSPWNSARQNTGVGSLSLLPRIEPGSPALQADSLCDYKVRLLHTHTIKPEPVILEWGGQQIVSHGPNPSPWVECSLISAVKKVLLEHIYSHSFTYCLWLLSRSHDSHAVATETI